MLPDVDISAFPIVAITFGATLSHEDIEQHYLNTLRLIQERGGFIGLVDTRQLTLQAFRAPFRRHLARRADELAKMGAIIAEIVVVSSSVARPIFLIYAYSRRSRSYPIRCFDDMKVARRVAEGYAERLARSRAIPKRKIRPRPQL